MGSNRNQSCNRVVKMAGFFLSCTLLLLFPKLTSCGALQLTSENLNEVLNNYELVFINFYADWCRFSQMLHPVYDETANKISQEFQTPGKVVFAKVDCDNQPTISQQYRVNKYPTLKLIRYGSLVKREYRGQRSVEALAQFIREQLHDPIKVHPILDEIENIDTNKRNLIGYFQNKETEGFKNFMKIASMLRDDCEFHTVIGDASASERQHGDTIMFRPPNTERQDITYSGELTSFETLSIWSHDKCVPLVREITFENAEELTEEGLPFLILFYHPQRDSDVIKAFQQSVSNGLITEKSNINFLTADGTKFTHPLYHLGKSEKDLPVLAIDSFRHMYVFKNDVRQDIGNIPLLKTFVADLHSGKLHREFHHGPDPVEQTTTPPTEGHIPKDSDDDTEGKDTQTSPPESTFAKLAPARNRYTILKDEL